MKDLFVGLAALLTAAAALIALTFERAFTDITQLQDKLARAGIPSGEAKERAETKRRQQKLIVLGTMLILAFVFSLVALLVNNGKGEPKPTGKCNQEVLTKCFDAIERENRLERKEIHRLAHTVHGLVQTLKHADLDLGAR
jgi:hypothetical protein